MNDSQTADYLEIISSLLSSRQQWEAVPQIVSLTIKAAIRLLEEHTQSFIEHKTLINEQSLKIKQLEMRMGSKVSKKDLEGEVMSIFNSKQPSLRREEDSLSEYDKLIKDSRYERDRNFPPTVQELKTIAQLIAEKRVQETNNQLKGKLLSQKLQIQDKIQVLKEEVKSRMVQIQKQRRQWVSECRQAHSRLEQSVIRPSYTMGDDKVSHLQQSNKRISEGLSHLINHIQQNFLTKQQVNLLMEREKQREKQKKAPEKQKSKQVDRNKNKEQQNQIQKIEMLIKAFKNEERRQLNEFKHNVNKQIGQMVNTQTVNNVIDRFQKDILERFKVVSSQVNKLQSKINSFAINHDGQTKEILTKSQKRAQKKTSPSKSIESIQASLIRLERTVLDRQLTDLKKMQAEMENKIKKYDQILIQQLNRRQKHLCQVIEQTYSQSLQIKSQQDKKHDTKIGIMKLLESNLYCRFLYVGKKQCKAQSCIPWEKQPLNNMPDNVICKNDSTILVNSPGLYKIQVGLFGEIDTESILLFNGSPFAQIPIPQKSKSTAPKIRGAHFAEIVLLPGLSKISVRMQQHFYGQAFLFMQKL